MTGPHRRATVISLVSAMAILLVACASLSPTTTPASNASATSPPSGTPANPSPAVSASAATSTDSPATPAAATGFAFKADDVLAYYASQGYACTERQPSTTAVGYTFRACTKVGDAGRTLTVGLVTDPSGELGDGFASVQGKDGEAFLAPVDALDPLAGFLGAMLGDERGSALLDWLAGHLGDVYAETETGPLKVATYTESDADVSKLFVELANDAYLSAPTP